MANSQPVVQAFKRALRDSNASPKVRKALLEAGIVESHLQNLNYGDSDSVGPLQQRPSQGWHNARNPYKAALDFIHRAQPLASKYATAGDLAQAVQVSAFPGRYQQHSGEAQALLRGGSYGKSGSYSSSVSKALTPPGADKKQIALGLLGFGGLSGGYGGGDPLTSALLAASQQKAAPASRGPAPTGKMPSGVADFEGHKVAAWIKPYLVKARQAGWKGQVNSGFRSYADQQRIYNSGVRPAAKPGTSNHEGTQYPRGAVDVSDAATLAAILKRLRAPLQWAGAKDPPHFSHPHGGSY